MKVSKNRDTIIDELMDSMRQSANSFMDEVEKASAASKHNIPTFAQLEASMSKMKAENRDAHCAMLSDVIDGFQEKELITLKKENTSAKE